MKKPRRILRAILGGLIAAVWLLIAALAFEAFAWGKEAWLKKHNPFMRSATGQDMWPGISPPPNAISIVQPPAESVSWQSFEQQDGTQHEGIDWANFALDTTQTHPSFPQFDEDDRQCFAALTGQTVAAFDAAGKTLAVYGTSFLAIDAYVLQEIDPLEPDRWPWVGTGWVRIAQVAREVAGSGQPREEQVTFERFGRPPATHTCYWLPVDEQAGSQQRVFAFVKGDPYASYYGDLPPDTPWDVPFVRYKKNLRGARSGMGGSLTTNNFGFRDDDIAVPKPPGTFRILCIGGSTTEEGATPELTYPNHLERMLCEEFPGHDIEVVNCGTSGIVIPGHFFRFEEYLQLEPDLVVAYMGVNEVMFRQLKAVRTRKGGLVEVLSASAAFRALASSSLHTDEETTLRDMNRIVMTDIDAFSRAFHCAGIRVAFCSIACPEPDVLSPPEWRYLDWDARTHWQHLPLTFDRHVYLTRTFNQQLHAFCTNHNILYVPVAESISANLAYFGDICHMRQIGIEAKARIILQSLKTYIQPALRQ